LKKTAIILCIFFVFAILFAGSVSAQFVYTPFEEAVTDLVDDLVAPATAILGAVLAIGGAILLVKVGFRWVRGFIR